MGDVVATGRTLVESYPDRAEPKIWLAIALSTDAGINGGLSALGEVKEARRLLESAEKIDPAALDGSIYTSLGSLYYQVPGWPIGFGNDDKAEAYLKQALAINRITSYNVCYTKLLRERRMAFTSCLAHSFLSFLQLATHSLTTA